MYSCFLGVLLHNSRTYPLLNSTSWACHLQIVGPRGKTPQDIFHGHIHPCWLYSVSALCDVNADSQRLAHCFVQISGNASILCFPPERGHCSGMPFDSLFSFGAVFFDGFYAGDFGRHKRTECALARVLLMVKIRIYE